MKLLHWLKLPEARTIVNLDDPSTTLLHAQIIRRKKFLRKLYIDFYTQFKKDVTHLPVRGLFVELGSGGGFIKEILPNVKTSDVLDLPNVDMHFSALAMPFTSHTVDAYLAINVLHHLPDATKFFREIDRTLKPGGRLIMVEEANTWWGRFIYRNFHHEPFVTDATDWGFPSTGPLSSANGAIAWIIFYRDRQKFKELFPSLHVYRLSPHTPLRYLLSGGMTLRQLLPSFTYDFIKIMETIMSPFNKYLGMFMTIGIEKIDQ
jgi:SAM-dependent methyltransferase